MNKTDSPNYNRWIAMMQRCNNPDATGYAEYGGRGIEVCERWKTFENFDADMGTPPTPNHSLERREVNGNYDPDNCTWATAKEQVSHRRY